MREGRSSPIGDFREQPTPSACDRDVQCPRPDLASMTGPRCCTSRTGGTTATKRLDPGYERPACARWAPIPFPCIAVVSGRGVSFGTGASRHGRFVARRVSVGWACSTLSGVGAAIGEATTRVRCRALRSSVINWGGGARVGAFTGTPVVIARGSFGSRTGLRRIGGAAVAKATIGVGCLDPLLGSIPNGDSVTERPRQGRMSGVGAS